MAAKEVVLSVTGLTEVGPEGRKLEVVAELVEGDERANGV